MRMKTPPIGDEFFEGQQDVLMAIHRALARLEVEPVPLETYSTATKTL